MKFEPSKKIDIKDVDIEWIQGMIESWDNGQESDCDCCPCRLVLDGPYQLSPHYNTHGGSKLEAYKRICKRNGIPLGELRDDVNYTHYSASSFKLTFGMDADQETAHRIIKEHFEAYWNSVVDFTITQDELDALLS